MRAFYHFVLKKSALSLTLLLIIMGFFIAQIPDFQLDASADSLVLEGDENLRYYQSIKKNYDSADYLLVSYQVDGDLFAKKQLSHLQKLQSDLADIKQIKSTSSILDLPLFASPPLSLIELATKNITLKNGKADLNMARQEFKNSPFYADNLVSLDGKTTAILLFLETNSKFAQLRDKRNQMRVKKYANKLSKKQLSKLKSIEKQVQKNAKISSDLTAKTIDNIRHIIDKHRDEARLFLGGLPMITTDIIAYISNDLLIFSLAVIALMSVILIFIFRGLRWVVMPIFISVGAALMMSGILAFFGLQVTVISSNFFSLLLVMTLSVTIHLIVRYRELAQNNPQMALDLQIKTTLEQMFKPCLFTTLTTFAAFASLLISGIKPVIDFGWMMSIGVTLALFLSFLLFPILMSLLPKPKIKAHHTELGFTHSLAQFSEKFGNHLLLILLVLIIASATGISKLSVENRFIDYFKKNTEISQGLTLIDEQLGGTIPLEIVLDDLAQDYWYDADLRREIHQLHQYLEQLEETGKVLSIDTFMQILTKINDGEELNGFFLKIIKSQIPESAKAQILTPYLSENTGQLRIVARIRESRQNLQRDKLIDKIEQHLSQNMGFKKDSFHLTGMLVLYNNMLQSLFASQIKTVSAVFLIIFVMFLFIFKSISLSILALIPNALPSLFILGIMGLLAIPLDLMTITIAAIAIGIGVDNAIHYIHRFKAEFSKDGDYLAAIYRSHNSIGLAMFYTSITVTLGFLILALSNFIPSIYFGIFTAIAVFSALLANLTLLPKLLLIFKPKINKN